MVGGVKSCLKSNPIPSRDALRLKQNLVCTRRPHRDWARPAFECLLQRCGSSMACHRWRGSGYCRPGYGISTLGEVAINSTIEPPELTQGWGNRLMEGTNKTLCPSEPRRKEQWPQKGLNQAYPQVSRSFWWRCGSVVASCRVWDTGLNQIPYNYIVEVTNIQGIRSDRQSAWRTMNEVHDIVRRQWSRQSPRKRNAKRQNGCLMWPYK